MRPLIVIDSQGIGRFLRYLLVIVALLLLVVYALWGVLAVIGASVLLLWLGWGVLRTIAGSPNATR